MNVTEAQADIASLKKQSTDEHAIELTLFRRMAPKVISHTILHFITTFNLTSLRLLPRQSIMHQEHQSQL
jgi:hypothetical protein